MKIAFDPNCSLPADEWISQAKPQQVFDACYNEAWDQLVPVVQIDYDQLALAHDPKYIQDILTLRRENGFCTRRADHLNQILWANGAFLAAAQEALKSGVCFAPVSGFHHACYGAGGGFCTFNGLVIAALETRASRVLIIDGDGHYGNGTQDIIEKLGLTGRIKNLTYGKGLPRGPESVREIEVWLKSESWDLVLYQAGADSYKDDPFGAGYLDAEHWRRRDEVVFNTCRDRALPVVWDLAGGYSPALTVKLHYDTFATACLAYEGAERRPPDLRASALGNRSPRAPNPAPRYGWPEEGL